MSTGAVVSHHVANPCPGVPARPSLTLVDDSCQDCGHALAAFEELVCADCADLAAHAWCRDCGAVLADARLDVGACAECVA